MFDIWRKQMNHNEIKKELLKDSETRKEYDSLELLYNIKSAIIRMRIEKGWSQKELAEQIGTKQSAVSRLESGSYNPSIAFLCKIALAFEKKINIRFE